MLVTSRNRLTSLVAAEGAHALSLDLLTIEEARDLLARRLGAAHTHLGDAHHAGGDWDSACASRQDALTIFEQLAHPDADQVRLKLSKFGQATPEDQP